MFGNVTALEGLHVTGKSCGLGSSNAVEPRLITCGMRLITCGTTFIT